MGKKRIKRPIDRGLAAALARLTPAQLRAAHKIAKDPARGLTPFFTSAYSTIALRDAANK
jgi:hypothetical protein